MADSSRAAGADGEYGVEIATEEALDAADAPIATEGTPGAGSAANREPSGGGRSSHLGRAARRTCLDEWGRDEQELVRRCKEGSEAAYAVLVRLHRPRLYTLAYRLLLDREAAEDVVQETFIAAFRQMERFEPRPSLAAWLNTIALRTATRAAARQRSRPKTSIDALAFRDNGRGADATDWSGDHLGPGLGLAALADTSPGTDPEASAEAADLRRALSAAIVELPFKYRAAVVLRHVMGLDYAEAARVLDLPLNTFKSHLLRGTKLLREGLTADLEAPGSASTGPNGRHPGEVGERTGETEALVELAEAGDSRPAPERIAGG